MKSLDTSSYKGVRDFYPEDMFIQKYIFSVMRKTVEKYGYSEYDASILESADLYKAKTGEEIVNEQTYTFVDRGEREVTLRPEMTPTIARMIAKKKKELNFPIRWYSIPNLFRYERPQKGRLREHWQLNVDIFGVKSISADIEIISIANALMKAFGVDDSKYVIKINDRVLMCDILKGMLGLDNGEILRVSKIIDKKSKVEKDEFEEEIKLVVGEKRGKKLLELLNSDSLSSLASQGIKVDHIIKLIEELNVSGISNVKFDLTIVRGFDYYTGMVFEIFDKSEENNRTLFGGGRYDDLLDIFGEEKVPAVGFGMGDVTIRDILKTYNVLPIYTPSANLFICTLDEKARKYALGLAEKLRDGNLNVIVNVSEKKIGDQIKYADKCGIPFILCIGDNEIEKEIYKIKQLATGEEEIVSKDKITEYIKERVV